ncbi:class I SAM-dependent methyltransferase [Bacillus sp. FJAT-29790]|uniref:class I SAM-dependent methyltransferase n=1 Tax=Bacillus sp. FJAT-29790 TaxID=1895002 RepID=UPI001C24BD7D|nr:class I SAM-dependent methyltransferase [Bacillus sp. FJAT-29790]MBU8878977.1 class I SAM-dependent methyltransferase [Bacillus sp. FJAT-29790]
MSQFNWTAEAEKQWDDRSETWNSKSREMWESGSRKDIAPFFAKHVKMGSSVCDLGCGDGFGSLKLAESGYAVTGMDVSEEMIRKAREINIGNSAVFQKGDISSLPFADSSLEAVLAINSLEWTENPLKVLKEIQKVVKPGGLACIGILGPTAGPRENSYRRLYDEKVICNTMMPWEFERLAAENNWTKFDELGVYKRSAEQLSKGSLPVELKQSLSFMWVFMLRNEKQEREI